MPHEAQPAHTLFPTLVASRFIKDSEGSWLLSGGALYMLGEHVGLTSEAFYQRNHNNIRSGASAESTSSSKTYGLQWGISAFIF